MAKIYSDPIPKGIIMLRLLIFSLVACVSLSTGFTLLTRHVNNLLIFNSLIFHLQNQYLITIMSNPIITIIKIIKDLLTSSDVFIQMIACHPHILPNNHDLESQGGAPSHHRALLRVVLSRLQVLCLKLDPSLVFFVLVR